MQHTRDYLYLLRYWLWLFIVGALLGGILTFVVARQVHPTYETNSLLLINAKQQPNSLTYNDVMLSQQLALTYSKMAVQPVVLQQVIQKASLHYTLEQLEKLVSATPIPNTQIITITAKASSPQQAQVIAELVAQTFIDQQRQRLASGESSDTISIVQPAIAPTKPVTPNVKLDTALGLIFGAIIAVGVAALVTYFDDTVKSQQDVESLLNLPVLGVVSRDSREAGLSIEPDRVSQHRHSAEMFRIIRTNLDFTTLGNQKRLILVTSTQKGEGKTTTAAKLAVALAETGRRVILVDADLRIPTLHQLFQLQSIPGLTSILIDENLNCQDLLQSTALPTLKVLTSGAIPPNPAELLQSKRMGSLLEALRGQADAVLIDSPPILAVADAMTLAPKVDGVVFVLESGSVRLGRIKDAISVLERSGTSVLGIVLNKISRMASAYYNYDYRYSANFEGSEPIGARHHNGRVASADLAPSNEPTGRKRDSKG